MPSSYANLEQRGGHGDGSQAVVRRIEQAAAEASEELDLARLELTELPPEIGSLR